MIECLFKSPEQANLFPHWSHLCGSFRAACSGSFSSQYKFVFVVIQNRQTKMRSLVFFEWAFECFTTDIALGLLFSRIVISWILITIERLWKKNRRDFSTTSPLNKRKNSIHVLIWTIQTYASVYSGVYPVS